MTSKSQENKWVTCGGFEQPLIHNKRANIRIRLWVNQLLLLTLSSVGNMGTGQGQVYLHPEEESCSEITNTINNTIKMDTIS